jgi:hypothetical protein
MIDPTGWAGGIFFLCKYILSIFAHILTYNMYNFTPPHPWKTLKF